MYYKGEEAEGFLSLCTIVVAGTTWILCPMDSSRRTQLKTGHRPVQQNVRTYKPDEVLFEEGSTGRELYIVNEGEVGVYKGGSEGTLVELARIGPGGVIGEMSLLDNLPRSATVKAVETTKALVIVPQMFHAAMQKVPVWLNSIIKIVVSRLRDANKRVDQSVLRDRERGIAALLLLLLPSHKYEHSSMVALDYNLVLLEAYYVCRLKKKEIMRLLDQLVRRKIIEIQDGEEGKKHVCFKDLEVLSLFEEFLNLKGQQKSFRELNIPEEAVTMLSNIAYVAQKVGSETAEGTVLSRSALLEDLQDKSPDQLDKSLLDLRRRSLVNLMPEGDETQIVFRKDVLSRIKKIKEWLPRFEQS